MPELPDVELARRRLLNEIVGKEIASFELVKTATKVRTLQDIAEEEFRNAVVGAAFEDLQRKGKFLIAPLDTGESIVFHFMLSGWLDFFPTEPGAEEKAARRAKLKFTFEDGSVLIFSDPRNMGRVFLVKSGDFESVGVLARMGIEPLGPDFTLDRFRAIFESHAGKTVKDLLRDQERIAGIGNIYSDEIMRRAGVRPDRRAGTLSDEEAEALFQAVPDVLREAVSELEAGRPGHMLEWRKKGAVCPGGCGEVEAVKHGASHYYWCPECQH